MNRKSFLLSLPLVGLAAKAFSKPEELKPMFNVKLLKARKDFLLNNPVGNTTCSDDGCILVWFEDRQEFVKGNFEWTDDTKSQVKFVEA